MAKPAIIKMISEATVPTVSNTFVNNKSDLCSLQISGTFTSATIKVEGIVDVNSGLWVSLATFDLSDLDLKTSGMSGKSIYRVGVSGILRIRINVTAVSGGSITVVTHFIGTSWSGEELPPSAEVPFTAYDEAVLGGYTGTKADFEAGLANVMNMGPLVQQAQNSATAAATSANQAATAANNAASSAGNAVISANEAASSATQAANAAEHVIDTITPEAIAQVTTEWLNNNVDPVGSAVVVDSSLTISGAAADAKVTGENITNLKTAANDANYILDSCIKYWADFEKLEINSAYAARRVSVDRLGQITIFGGTTSTTTHIKLSGACDRAATITNRNNFAKEISLIQGHSYTLSAKIVSGSYSPNTSDLTLIMYDSNNNQIVTFNLNENANESVTPATNLIANIVLTIPGGLTITNLKIFVTLQDITTASETNGVFKNIDTKIDNIKDQMFVSSSLVESFDADDVLLKDGINGVKTIAIEDVKTYMQDGMAAEEDITELRNSTESDVAELKKYIGSVSGNIVYDNWVYDYRINTSGDSVDLSGSTAVSSNGHAYQIIDCVEGDKFTLTGKETNAAYRLWCWCASDGTVISKPNTNLDYTDEVIICPENATKLVVNTSTSGSYSLYSGKYLNEQVKDLYNNIVDPDNFSGTDTEKITAAMSAIGDSNHGVILIKRQYQLTDNIYVTHLGNADARLIFLGVGSDNPGFSMGIYGFQRPNGATSYGALSFINILFKATSTCNMFTANNILRVNFENCVFDGFNHIIYATRFVQTYYFTDCLIRNGSGIAIEGSVSDQVSLIDVRLTNCIVEKSTHLMTGYGFHGVYITGCCIEGNDGYVVKPEGDCRDLVIDNCYFESQNIGYGGGTDGNGMCFDFRSISGIVHNIAITNNMFGGLKAGNTIIMLPYRMMVNTKFTVINNWLSAAASTDPNVESGAYLVAVPNNAVNVYKNLRFDQNVRAKKYDPNHLIIDLSEGNTSVASLLVTEYYMTHDDQGNETTRYNPGFWYVCEDLNDLYAPGYYHISADIPIAHSPVNTDFYLINMRTNETVIQIAITSNGLMSRIGTGNWVS